MVQILFAISQFLFNFICLFNLFILYWLTVIEQSTLSLDFWPLYNSGCESCRLNKVIIVIITDHDFKQKNPLNAL